MRRINQSNKDQDNFGVTEVYNDESKEFVESERYSDGEFMSESEIANLYKEDPGMGVNLNVESTAQKRNPEIVENIGLRAERSVHRNRPTYENSAHEENHPHYFSPSLTTERLNYSVMLQRLQEEAENEEELHKLSADLSGVADNTGETAVEDDEEDDGRLPIVSAGSFTNNIAEANEIDVDGDDSYNEKREYREYGRDSSISESGGEAQSQDSLIEKCQREMTWDEASGLR